MHTIATQAHLAQDSVLAWRKHSRTPRHHRLTLTSLGGTLSMRVDTHNTRSAVLATTHTVILGSAVEKGPPPLHGTLTGITPFRGISVMG
jgi:hypothetical protein